MPAPAPRTMMHLAKRSDYAGGIGLAIHLVLILAAGWLVSIAGPVLLVPAMVLLGGLQAALFAPFHETCHYTAFANRRANAVIGWLVALPSLHNWPMYQAFHRVHHLYTHDPERDPELTVPDPSTLGQYGLRIAGWTFWKARFEWFRDGLKGDLSAYTYIRDGQQARLILGLRLQCAVTVAAALAITALFGWPALLLYWILPQLIGQVLLRMYLLTEHTGLPHSRDGLVNTRTTLTLAALRLVMWNMPYHAEHHLYPFIPFYQLSAAHRILRDQLQTIQPGYARWQWQFARSVIRKSA